MSLQPPSRQALPSESSHRQYPATSPKRSSWFASHKAPTAVLIAFGLAVISGVGVVLGTDGSDSAPETTAIQRAANSCEVVRMVGDDGHSLEVATSPGGPASIADVACISIALDMPDAIVTRIDSTNALMGMQEGKWDAFTASWAYHPDNGLLLICEES